MCKKLSDCSQLVLCKNELFFQKDNGETITSWYPVSIESAAICSLYFNIPLIHDNGEKVDINKIIEQYKEYKIE